MVTPRSLRSSLVGVLVACVSATTAAGVDSAPPCTASAEFDRDHASVGQQVRYQVRVERRDEVTGIEWLDAPSLPGFRVEWLPDVVDADAELRTHFERRAVFAERAGRQASAPARLSCRNGADETVIEVAPVFITIEAPPSPGRPADFAGLIGPIAIEQTVTPRQIQLGESFRVALMFRGRGDLRQLDDPFPELADADIFRRTPESSSDSGDPLTLKRHFYYDIVPTAVGDVEIPATAVAYFDPDRERFGTATSEAVTVRVDAATPGRDRTTEQAAAAQAPRNTSEPGAADSDQGPPPWSLGFAVVAASALLATLAIRMRRKRGTRAARAAALALLGATPPAESDAAGFARALRTALAPHLQGALNAGGALSATPEELAGLGIRQPAVAAAIGLLAEIERARFDLNSPRPNLESIRAAILKL